MTCDFWLACSRCCLGTCWFYTHRFLYVVSVSSFLMLLLFCLSLPTTHLFYSPFHSFYFLLDGLGLFQVHREIKYKWFALTFTQRSNAAMDIVFCFQPVGFFKETALLLRTEKKHSENKLISFLQIIFFLSSLLKLLSILLSFIQTIKLIKVKLHFCRHLFGKTFDTAHHSRYMSWYDKSCPASCHWLQTVLDVQLCNGRHDTQSLKLLSFYNYLVFLVHG